MYLGNEIMLSSDRLTYCLFESNWIDQPQATKKLIILFVERLKKPHVIEIGLYTLSLGTFTGVRVNVDLSNILSQSILTSLQILKFAYDMFNVLQNFN